MHLNQQEVTRINGYFRHRQISQQRVLEGKVNDKLTLNIWCKCYATHNVNLKAFIKIAYDHIGEKKYYFDFEKHQSNWQLLSAYVNAEDDYGLISVGIVYNGTKEAYFNCLQLFKGLSCREYQYDNLARLVNVQSDLDHNAHVTYSSNKPQIVHTQDGNYYQYEYNEDGLLTKIIPSLGAVTEYIYDDSSRLIKTKTTSNNITFENEYQYDDNGNIVSQKDEFQNESTFTYDHLRRINSTTYPNLLKENKSYNIVSSLLALSYATSSNPNTIIHQNNISYDSNYVELTSYSSLNGGTYTFNYDQYGRLINIHLGENTLIAYTYNDNVNGVPSPLIKEKQYGLEGTKYTFIYDDNDLISKIKLGELSLFTFTYNQDNLPVEIYDLGNNQTTYFKYDDEGRLTKTICGTTSISYQYDVMNNISKKVYGKGTKVIDEYYDYDYETSLFSKNGFINRLSQKYFDELVLAKFHPHGMFGLSALNYLYEVVDDRDVEDKSYYFDNINQYLHYDLTSVNANRKNLSHLYTPFISSFRRQKTFYMWFRPNIITGKEITLFKLKNSSLEKNNIVCSICLNGNGKVVCKDKNKTILITSTNCVYNDDYNFLCFKIKNQEQQ